MTNVWRAIAIVLVLLSALQIDAARAENPRTALGIARLEAPTCGAKSPTDKVVVQTGAFLVYRNPATGNLETPPQALEPALPARLELRLRPLVERRSTRPGGGVEVDLAGRFTTALVASRRADGGLDIACTKGVTALQVDSEAPDGERKDR